MSPQTATLTARSAQRTTETWVWRDTSFEGLAPGTTPQQAPPPRGCF